MAIIWILELMDPEKGLKKISLAETYGYQQEMRQDVHLMEDCIMQFSLPFDKW